MESQETHPAADPRVNLYDLPPGQLDRALSVFEQPRFRVTQIRDWLYSKRVASFEEMRNLPAPLRAELASRFTVSPPEVAVRSEPAPDGSTKYLFALRDGALVESVVMPMRGRSSICLSSQAGCAVGCTFCVTGFFGAGRDLTPAEMVGQSHVIRRERALAAEQTNIVYMGMGEPLLNVENVATSLEIFTQEISPKRITVSTSGIIPGIEDLARIERRPNLAVSINAPDQERRERIMPITKKYPLADLMRVLRGYPHEKGREITIEYVLLAGFNDAPADAKMLARLIAGLRCKVNAIPFNPDPNLPTWMERPGDAAIDRFGDALAAAGVTVTIRRSKGLRIAAACGQLRGRTDRLKRRVKSEE